VRDRSGRDRRKGASGSRRFSLLFASMATVAVTLIASSGEAGASRDLSAPNVLSRTTPFEVIGELPTPGNPSANGAAAIVIRLSGLLQPLRKLPTISPTLPGRWIVHRNELIFRPRGALPPGTKVTVSIPSGSSGVHNLEGHPLARALSWSYTVGPGSLLGAEQMLAGLGYLPARFVAGTRKPWTVFEREREAFVPARGRWVWSWGAPTQLRSQWASGRPSPIVTGALMAFQAQENLPMTGVLDPQVWSALLGAVTRPADNLDRAGYTYALVDKAIPETMTVWHDGRVVLRANVNTGIPQAPTSDGTYPVYERLASQVMKGVNPNGSPYADPVAWVAYFNGGDAVHYIARADYGFPQSLGCVELPYAQAEAIWPALSYGTLVTVEG